ncbi:MAG TPA: PAS domain-containing protein [Pyrinomonadaceae bacterium]|nr:PAS domain-containing protein [Pyrinomonadaceae bacterium]
MPLSEICPEERETPEEYLSASVRQLEALTALAAAPAGDGRALEELFAGLADTITELTDYRTCLVLLFNEDGRTRRIVSWSSNIPGEYVARAGERPYPREEVARLVARGVRIDVGALGYAAYYPPSHYQLLDSFDARRFKSGLKRPAPGYGADAWHDGDELFVPLFAHDGEFVGLIALDDPRSGRAPDRRSVLPAVAFARQAAQLVARQRDAAKLAAQAEREALINRITRAVRQSLDADEVFRAATRELGRQLGVDRCALFMIDREAGVVRNVAEYTVPGVSSAGGEYPIRLVSGLIQNIRGTGVLAFEDVERDPAIRPVYEHILRQLGTRSIMYVAIRVGDELPGCFAISTVGETRRWRPEDVSLARAVADQTGIAVRQAELFQMVERAKRAWETTFDAMSDGIYIFSNDRRLTRVNRAGAALEGAEPQELLGRGCCDILRAGRGEGCIIERVTAERRPVTTEYTPEALGRTLLVTAEPVVEGSGLVGTVCTVRDLSELRHIEAVARERQSLLEHVLESARENIAATDTEGRLTWINSAGARMCGYAKEALIGQHFRVLIEESERPAAEERFRRTLAGEPQRVELRLLRANGEIRYIVTDSTPLVIDGRTTGTLAITRDVTEQRAERERAAQADKLRALGQLASGVAHDFNNALAAILGRAQLLRRSADGDARLTRGLDIILTAAEDAAATVRRIRSFARQLPGEGHAEVSVTGLLRDAVEITRTRWENDARSLGLRYEVTVEGDDSLHTRGNASELREVFVNLVVNAIDAMPAGGRLAITCRRRGERLRLLFADTGTGMDEGTRARIFEPFFTTKGVHGTGLGLFVSYGIVERHGGHISAASQPGRGTTFTIDLPHAEAARPEPAQPAPESESPARPLSVLVVDDEEHVRETLAEMVEALGHRARRADSGRAALAALDEGEFDLVFTDLSMPEMDGWEVARAVRRRSPRTRIAVVTGYGRDAARTQGDAPADTVIGKPFNFAQVEEVLKQFG